MSNPLALIIEDDENQADIFSLALRRARFEVEIVQEGDKALTRLTEIVPAIVILDLHLPHVSGEMILTALGRLIFSPSSGVSGGRGRR